MRAARTLARVHPLISPKHSPARLHPAEITNDRLMVSGTDSHRSLLFFSFGARPGE